MSTTTQRFREGDSVVTVTTTVEVRPAEMHYDDILAACKVEVDGWATDPPWLAMDGWEHDVDRADNYPDTSSIQEARGFVSRDRRDGGNVIIKLGKPFDDGYGTYQALRQGGASKQVAREAVALMRRQAIDQLVRWYNNGWEWYEVIGDFMGYAASCSGIDDYAYALKEVRREIANEIAAKMEDDGYTVVGKPARTTGKYPIVNWSLSDYQAHYRSNLHRQDWASVDDSRRCSLSQRGSFGAWYEETECLRRLATVDPVALITTAP